MSSIKDSEAVELHQAVLEHVRAAGLEIRSVAGKVEDCVAERLAIASDQLDSIIQSIYTETLRAKGSDAAPSAWLEPSEPSRRPRRPGGRPKAEAAMRCGSTRAAGDRLTHTPRG